MNYTLVEKEKIKEQFGNCYLQNNIMQSLKTYLETHKDDDILDEIENDAIYYNYLGCPVLRINDVNDERCMLEFAVFKIERCRYYKYLVLGFIGRAKC